MSLLNKIFKTQIYCISCLHRKDRYLSSVDVFQKMDNEPTIVKYHRPIKDPRGGIYGCYDEHRSCMKEFWDSGEDYALITEDDIDPTEEWKERLLNILPLMKSNTYDIINLTNKAIILSEDNNVWYRGKGLRTLSYIISRRYLEKFNGLIQEATGKHIDVMLFWNSDSPIFAAKTYFIHEPIFRIKEFDSDIREGIFNKIERLIGAERIDNFLIWICRLIYIVLKYFGREDLFETWGLRIIKILE
jgi:hypothetical protein